jgi:hypothetical protein
LIDVHEFELMQERLEILEDIYRAEEQLAAGGGVPHDEARARVQLSAADQTKKGHPDG